MHHLEVGAAAQPAALDQDPRQELLTWVGAWIAHFLATSPGNNLSGPFDEPAWDRALVGLAAGDDGLWDRYKQAVGPHHHTPAEMFNLHHPERPAQPAELGVISYVLPQRQATREDNRREKFYPSDRWVMARFPGEDCNQTLQRELAQALNDRGIPALAPQLSPHWSMLAHSAYGKSSNWSQRHAAHAAGLGTFGLCDGLITPAGKAHRLGSLVVRQTAPATPRPYQGHRDWCLYFFDGTCGACIKRCPAGAVDKRGHDKARCWDHAGGTCAKHVEERFGFKGYGCGLCQTKVPCESGIPAKILRAQAH